MQTTNITELRKNIKSTLNKVSQDKETIIIHRAGEEDIVMISLSDYNNIMETAYLFSTKANRDHLQKSIQDAKNGNSKKIKLDDLWN